MKTKKILVLATLLTVSASVFAQKTGRVIIPEKNLKFKANDDFTEVTITDFVYDKYEESRKFDGKFLEVPSKIQGVPVTAIQNDRIDVFGRYSDEIEGLYIPDCVKTIGERAFEGSRFKTIRLPSGLKEIPSFCFYSCFAENIEIPDSVKEIGQEAFKCAHHLKTVNIPAGVQLSSEAFDSCSMQTLIFPKGRIYFDSASSTPFANCNNLEKIIIPPEFEVIINENRPYGSTRATLTNYDINGDKINANFALQKQIKAVKLRYRNEVEAEEKLPVYQEEYNSLYKAGNYKEAIEKAKAALKLSYTSDDVEHWRTLLLNAQLEEYFLSSNIKDLEATGSVAENGKDFEFRISLEKNELYSSYYKEFKCRDSLEQSFRVKEDLFLEHLNKATGKEYKIQELDGKYYLSRPLTKEELSAAKKAQKKDKLKSYKDSFMKILKD